VRIEEFEARTQRSRKCFKHSNADYEKFSVWKNCLGRSACTSIASTET